MQQILINAVSSYVRLALRAYFTFVLILIGFLGDKCCALRVRYRLYRREMVDLRHMTGWLSGVKLVVATNSFRGIPAGWLGIMMLLVAILGIVCDLAVSGLVVTTKVVDRCHFNTTGGYATLSDVDFELRVYLVTAGDLYDTVTRAQTTSQLNGGIDGIYHKVNEDLSFRADRQDIVGEWSCVATGETRTFSAETLTQTIIDTLPQEGLLYKQAVQGYYDNSGSGQRGSFVWSAQQGDYATGPWTVRAALNTNLKTSEPKVMAIYSCNMDAPSVEWLLPLIQVDSFLLSWAQIVQASIYPAFTGTAHSEKFASDPGEVIASKLNAAMMVAGTSWGIKASPRTIDDPTQGCLALRTLVPWSVAGLFLVVALLTLILTVYMIAMQLVMRSARQVNSPAHAKAIEDHTPNGLIGWVRQAVEETNVSSSPTYKRGSWAAHWRFGSLNNDGRVVGLIFTAARDEQTHPLTMLSPRTSAPKIQ